MNSIHFNGKFLDFTKPRIMVIVNLTLDSFYANSRYKLNDRLFSFLDQSIKDGASIIDVGAMSSKPYSVVKSEKRRIGCFTASCKRNSQTIPQNFYISGYV